MFHLINYLKNNNNLWDYVYIKYKLLIFKELKCKSPLLSFNSTNIHREPEHCPLEELFCLLSLPLDYNPRERVLTRDWTQFKSVSKLCATVRRGQRSLGAKWGPGHRGYLRGQMKGWGVSFSRQRGEEPHRDYTRSVRWTDSTGNKHVQGSGRSQGKLWKERE